MSNVEKNEPCDRQADPVKRVSRMVEKFRVDRNTEGKVADRLVRETSGRKEVTGRERNLRSMTIPSYDIDGMTVEELHASLQKITENARQPFSFLADISKEFARDDYHLSTKAKEPTDIDVSKMKLYLFQKKKIMYHVRTHAFTYCHLRSINKYCVPIFPDSDTIS